MNDDTNNSVNDEAFEDGELSALYRETRIEQPSSQMDQAVLAMATQHVQHQPHPVSPFSARWPITASMVAILVLGFGLVTLMRQELGPEQATQVRAPQKMTSTVKKKAELKSNAVTSESDSASLTAPAESESAGALAVPSAKPAAPPVSTQPALRSIPQSAKQKKKAAAIPPQAPMALSDRVAPQPQAEKKAIRAERQVEQAARLKAPQAVISKKSEPAPTPLAKQEQTFNSMAQGIVSEEAGRSLQKSQSVGAQSLATVCRGSLVVIPPQDYWRAYIAGDARVVQMGRTSACVVIASQGNQVYRTIALTALQDRVVKLKVYKALLNETMNALTVKKLSTAAQQDIMGKLQRLTGLNLTTMTQWNNWYASNRSTLILSADGKYLVPQTQLK